MAHGSVDGVGCQRCFSIVWKTHCESNFSSLAHALGNKHCHRAADDHPAPNPDRDELPNRHYHCDSVAESYAQCNCFSNCHVYPILNLLACRNRHSRALLNLHTHCHAHAAPNMDSHVHAHAAPNNRADSNTHASANRHVHIHLHNNQHADSISHVHLFADAHPHLNRQAE